MLAINSFDVPEFNQSRADVEKRTIICTCEFLKILVCNWI